MTRATTLSSGPAAAQFDNDTLYETVNGQRVELPPMGAFEAWIANRLVNPLGSFVESRKTGQVVVEMLFRLALPTHQERRPDVAYVSYDRWPKNRPVPRRNAWDVTPNLAVEVISPTNAAEEVHTKVHEYFQAGVDQVWVVFPVDGEVYIYTSPTNVRILQRTDVIEGNPLFPGFKLQLAEWLAAPTPD
jgi:Uma2 family endonuclease